MQPVKPIRARYVIATLSYIGLVVLLNALFVYLPYLTLWGQRFTIADTTVGIIYLVRDFAQREIRHYVLVAMLIGAGLSYVLASRDIAVASVMGFVVGELIDWLIYTFTKKPLSQRLLASALISAPIDSYVFIAMLGPVHSLEWSIMTFSKFIGVFILWSLWKIKIRRQLALTLDGVV